MSYDLMGIAKRTLAITKQNWQPMMALAVVFTAPYAYLAGSTIESALMGNIGFGLFVKYALLMTVGMVSVVAMQTMLLSLTLTRDAAGGMDLHRAFERAKTRLIPMLLTSLLQGVIIMVGFICLYVPGIILSIGLITAVPLSVAGNEGPVETLKASWAMTDGQKMDIFIAWILLGLGMGVLLIPVYLVLGAFAGVSIMVGLPYGLVIMLSICLAAAILTAPGITFFTLLYEAIRDAATPQTPQMMDRAPGHPPQQQYGQTMGPPPAGPPAG